jgi:hypothetical protein
VEKGAKDDPLEWTIMGLIKDHQSNVGDVKKIMCTNISPQRRKNEDTTQHPRGYYNGRHRKKYSRIYASLEN